MKKDVAQYLEFAFDKLERLKQSDRGEVWLARNRQSGEIVIIKHVNLTGLPYDALKKFRFTLPAKVFLCAEDDTDTVIVEEFIHGENLIERLERQDFLSEAEARKILLQMCDGLAELHAQKIIHRDIKPSNLILQGDKIRLIDFDAARIFKLDKNADTHTFGTKGYAPPEQHGYMQTDERSDIFSLGVTMKVLLGNNLRGQLETILDKCTKLDPKDRFQNVDELKAALTVEADDKIALTVEKSRHKKFLTATIFTAAIVLFVNAQHLNRDENFSEPVTSVEEIPHVVEQPSPVVESKLPDEKIPAQVDEFKFPTIVTPTQTEFSLPPLPESQAVTPRNNFQLPPVEEQPSPVTPPKNYSGFIKTEFFLNESPFNQFEHVGKPIKISRDEWRQTQARLHIVNDSGRVWLNPTVKFILGQNWGENAHKVNETKTLPALGVDEATDVVIPFNLMTVSDRANTSAYIQIRLSGDGAESDETYWSTWFDITD
ncbi:MAG: protein kinase [Selenomonadaceae bacterium]|nr:protein kinase [Selenomonadaceae bacterium]